MRNIIFAGGSQHLKTRFEDNSRIQKLSWVSTKEDYSKLIDVVGYQIWSTHGTTPQQIHQCGVKIAYMLADQIHNEIDQHLK